MGNRVGRALAAGDEDERAGRRLGNDEDGRGGDVRARHHPPPKKGWGDRMAGIEENPSSEEEDGEIGKASKASAASSPRRGGAEE